MCIFVIIILRFSNKADVTLICIKWYVIDFFVWRTGQFNHSVPLFSSPICVKELVEKETESNDICSVDWITDDIMRGRQDFTVHWTNDSIAAYYLLSVCVCAHCVSVFNETRHLISTLVSYVWLTFVSNKALEMIHNVNLAFQIHSNSSFNYSLDVIKEISLKKNY